MDATIWVVCRNGEYGAQTPLIAATDAKDALALFDAMQRVDWSPEGPIIITASGYEHAAHALAGLRCAAREDHDG